MSLIGLNEKESIYNNNKSKTKQIIKCIFCEKLETQFRHAKIQQKKNKINSLNIQTINEIKEQKENENEINKLNISNSNNINDSESNSKLFRKSKYSIESKDKENKDENKKVKKIKKLKKKTLKLANKEKEEEKKEIKKEEKSEKETKPKKSRKKSIKNTKKVKKKKNSSDEEESPDSGSGSGSGSGVEAGPNSGEESEEEEYEEEEKAEEKSEEKVELKEEKKADEKSEEKDEKKEEEKEEEKEGVKEEIKEPEKVEEEKEPEQEPPEPEYQDDQNTATLPVMLTNLNSGNFDIYYKNFEICGHAICYNCIARLVFTSYLNELPSYDDITIPCKCNRGTVKISIYDLEKISTNLNLPEEEKICDKHGLIQVKFCLECKKNLCKKCIESHVDLFGENLHHLENESPPHTELCKDHPTCFLDTLCNDCHKTICHLCLVEGNKHYCHKAVSFNSMKLNIIKNVENMKFSSYDLFQKGVEDLNNTYDNLYNEQIKLFNDHINKLIENINEYRDQFLSNLKMKYEQKNQTLQIIKNIYEFFFKEYATIPKSVDYPVLCLYQVFNSEFISFRLDVPEINNPFINKILENVMSIDNSDNFQNKYQFSLKNYIQSQSIINHTDSINSLCCLEDGRIVTGGEDKKVLIWAKTFDKIDLALLDNPKPIKLVKTLNDGRLIVGSYQTLKIYNNANNFKVSCILKDISNNVLDLINLDDGRIICGSYREIKVYNMTWNSLYKDGKSIKEHTSWVTSLIKLNGKRFASGSEDKQIIIFDYNMKILRRIMNKFSVSVLCNKLNNNIIYDEDNYNNFYIGDYEGRIYLYKFTTQNMITVSENDQHNSKINSIIPLYGGNYCSIAQESKIIIHDGDFNPIQTINNNDQNKSVNSVVQLYNGKIITGNQLGGLNIYE